MHSGKRAVNCIPCAKRKVRCDKGQPCSNCKRRKSDVCAYPVQRATAGESHSENSAQRVERLESYIRRLGGDLQLAEQIIESGNVDTQKTNTRSSSTKASRLGNTTSTSRPYVNTSSAKRTEGSIGRSARLVEHDEQVTCIEAYVKIWALTFAGDVANDCIPDRCGTAGAAQRNRKENHRTRLPIRPTHRSRNQRNRTASPLSWTQRTLPIVTPYVRCIRWQQMESCSGNST